MGKARIVWSGTLLAVLVVLIPSLCGAYDSLSRLSRPWTGDLAEMVKLRRPVRVLVSYNRTNFFVADGEMRGFEVDFMNAYKRFLKKGKKRGTIRLVYVPVPFDDLFSALEEGRGDIVAAGLTVTDERSRRVAFTDPYRVGVNEIVVGNDRSAVLEDLKDLSGKTVHVLVGSSYVEHLLDVNKKLVTAGRLPVVIVEADGNLVTEDLLEMVNRDLIEYTVADNHVAEIWKVAFPGLRLFRDVPIARNSKMAWAVRRDNPELLESLNAFVPKVQEGTLKGNMFFKRYYENVQHVINREDPLERARMAPMAKLFRKYAEMYHFDWLKIAALAYQESRFNQKLTSNKGAVGVMQIKPSTAADKNIGIKDVYTLEDNIHAGVKYLRFLCDQYYQDVSPEEQIDFALAAYNAGPAKIRRVREKAVEMGLNPNVWFGNVEWAALNVIGFETPNYVAHVQMYYASYKALSNVLGKRQDIL